MYDCAVGSVAGDHAEAVVEIHGRHAAVLAAESLHVELGGGLAGGEAALDLHEQAYECGAVALHGLVEPGYLCVVLCGFEHGYSRSACNGFGSEYGGEGVGGAGGFD